MELFATADDAVTAATNRAGLPPEGKMELRGIR